ncbi:MAG: ribosome recycling factor [Nitrospirota bacterium]|nr:ribosome recycling factor [Nitrospirota bacterium]
MTTAEVKAKATTQMDGAIDALRREFATLRTGRASTALLDGIQVDYYDVLTPLPQVATLTTPDSRTLAIQPWESRIIPDIEKAILKSGLGLTPSNDGKLIRIVIPSLTEERRKELVKLAKKMAEESKVAVRNIRRDRNEDIKKLEKEKTITEDDCRRVLDEIQKLTDDHVRRIDEVFSHKEKEIMEV